ncbi:7515_t:CDS:2 [Rhizophagus irregularis]|nr:7515_t:CDS:2 [Rhizophagus irregularis]
MEQEVYEIRKTSIFTKDGETFACIDLVEKYHELLNKIKTRNSKAIACLRASKDYRCLNVIDNISFGNYYELRSAANVTLSGVNLGTRLQLGIGFGLFREGGSRGGSGNGSNGDSSGDKSDSNKNGCGGGSNGGVPDNKSGIYESSSENRGDSKAPSNSNEHSFGGGYNEGSTDRLEA